MDNKKFEQLINLITNEDVDQARALFHDIVVEKSREIYESMMDEEQGQLGGQVGDLLDEINVEEQGMNEEDDELDDLGDEGGEEISLDGDEGDFGGDDIGDEFGGEEAGEEGLEDRVVSLEDKLDELMAEFEEIMAGEEAEEEQNPGIHGDDGEEFGDEEAGEEGEFGGDDEGAADDEEPMMESAALQPVKGLYGSKIGGDDGVQNKSPALTKPKVVATGASPVKFAGGSQETMPSGPKGASNYGSKGETQVKGAGSFKNAAGQKKQDLEAAPKPTTSQASGVNNKSVVESRKRK